MRSTLFVSAIACILSVTLAVDSDKIEDVNAEVVEYIRDRMINFPMMRSAADHFACYDDLTRKINNITEEATEKSELCVKSANEQRASTLEQLKQDRSELAGSVSSIHNSFFGCARMPVGLDYFQCLKTAVQSDAEIMTSILTKSQQVIDEYADGLQVIETDEKTCLKNAVDEAKIKSDVGFVELRACLGQETASN